MNSQSSTIFQNVWNCRNISSKYWQLSVAREVESVVEKALVRAGRLRQAVPFGDDMLRSAFEGKL
jgi:hypothetical protein